MSDEKDRFGDKLRDAEKAREDQYFAKRDRELLEKAKAERSRKEEDHPKGQAHMRCPKDGERLVSVEHQDVTVEECPACRGLWPKGELEPIAHRESGGWLGRYLGRGR